MTAAFSRVCAVGIEYAVVWNHAPGRSLELAALHLRPVHADDLLLYRLPRGNHDLVGAAH